VENYNGRAVYFLDRPDGSFRSMTEISAGNISNRYVRVSDPDSCRPSKSGWANFRRRASSLACASPRKFDEDLMEKQFASLSARGIDFDKALASGQGS
jgi:hypothetical protein